MIGILHDAMTQNRETFQNNVEKGKYKILIKTNSDNDAIQDFIKFVLAVYAILIFILIIQYSLWLWLVATFFTNIGSYSFKKITIFSLLIILGLFPLYGISIIVIGLIILKRKIN